MEPPSIAEARIEIRHTWDGQPLPAERLVALRLALRRDHLRIGVVAPFHGDPPPPGPPGPTAGLWEHEVVELFIAADEAAAGPAGTGVRYTEVELSPWGHYLVLRLEGVRRPVASALPLAFRVRRRAGCWYGSALLSRSLLPPGPWRAAAFAVHGQGSARRFLAAPPLPGPAPDFHQPEKFPSIRWARRRP